MLDLASLICENLNHQDMINDRFEILQYYKGLINKFDDEYLYDSFYAGCYSDLIKLMVCFSYIENANSLNEDHIRLIRLLVKNINGLLFSLANK
jgi:hypothetical protein